MNCLGLALLFCTLRFCSGEELTTDEWMTTARCRAGCIQEYIGYPAADTQCIERTQCFVCWQMCERAFSLEWSQYCRPEKAHVCVGGCALACEFIIRSPTTSVSPDFSQWFMPQSPSVHITSADQLTISWSEPVSQAAQDQAKPVFAIFWKYDDQPTWKLLCMTSELWAAVDGPHTEYQGLLFRLLAVLPSGIIAERIVSQEEMSSFGASSDVIEQAPSLSGHPSQLNVLVNLGSMGGVLQAMVTWTPSLDLTLYTVEWGRNTCRVQDVLPPCQLTNSKYASVAESDMSKDRVSLTLPGLTYNSRYWIKVFSEGGHSSEQMVIDTPWCNEPDASFTTCLSGKKFQAESLPNLTRADLESHQRAQQVPIYLTLVLCLVIGVLLVIFIVVIIRKQHQFRHLVMTRSRSLRASVRQKASGVRDHMVSFRKSLRRRPRSQRMNPCIKRNEYVSDIESPMLPQRILSARHGRTPAVHRPPPMVSRYDDINELNSAVERSSNSNPKKTGLLPIPRGQRSLPNIPVTENECSHPYKNVASGKGSS